MMDALTNILSTIHLQGALHVRLEAAPPWGIDFTASDKVRFALISRGTCHLIAGDGSLPVLLNSGDCFLLMGRESFSLRDAPRSHALPCAEVIDGPVDGVVRLGDGLATTSIVMGWFSFDQGSQSLLADLLPPITCFKLLNKKLRTTQAALDLLSLEASSGAPGADLIVGRLSDILLVEAIRANLTKTESQQSGLLHLLADKKLARILRAIHADPAYPWTLDELAHVAGMSRSNLTAQFKRNAGQPVMDYLVRWRMRLAETRLRDPNASLSQISSEVGYDAESAFGRAFKRIMGISPGAYRQSFCRPSEREVL